MAMTTLTADTWTSLGTTSGDTIFQNRSAREIYLTSESTSERPLQNGIMLKPEGSIIIPDGKAMSGAIFNSAGLVYSEAL